ncbi:MAG: SulP family inorganic anion transporter [Clostridia bacterium]|nr:SulP family inorganic anion transporter [Clostridia bacterium]
MATNDEGWHNLKGDIMGGVTVAFVALPLALSFGVLSGAGAAAGVYGAIFTGILASLFGGTKAQISGPTGAMTVVLVEMFDKYGLDGLIAAMILAGLIQILMGILKLGKYIRLIPHPTIIGFTNGIGILIFIKQIEYFKDSPLLALLVIGLMFGLPLLNKKIPYALVALIAGTLAAKYWLPTDLVVGEIPLVFPSLHIPDFAALNMIEITKAALILALLGSVESLLASLIVDEMTQTKHDSDREIIGQGIANFVAAIFGNLIGTGAIVRSVVNVNAGGRGRLSGIIHGIVLLVLISQFGSLAGSIPLAVLGGILMATALKMIEYRETYRLACASKEALIVIGATTVLTVITDLTTAVAIGTLLSAIILLFNLGNSYLKEYPVDCNGLNKKIKSFTIEGSLFFGVSETIVNALKVKSVDADIVVINLMNSPAIDATGVVILGKIQEKLAQMGKKLILTGLKEDTYEKLVKLNILDGSEKRINLGRIAQAISYAQQLASENKVTKGYGMQNCQEV